MARELIADESRWTRGDYQIGDAFCAVGACGWVASGGLDEVEVGPVYEALRVALPESFARAGIAPVQTFNDDPETSHAEVLALFDRAIAAEEAKEELRDTNYLSDGRDVLLVERRAAVDLIEWGLARLTGAGRLVPRSGSMHECREALRWGDGDR